MTESLGTYTQLARAFVPKALGKVGQNVALTFRKRLCIYTLPFIVKVLTFAP